MSELKKVMTQLSMVSIPENTLLDGVIKLLDGRECFKDSNEGLSEAIYNGDIFEGILGELAEMDNSPLYPNKKVIAQLEELAELVSQDYFMVTKC